MMVDTILYQGDWICLKKTTKGFEYAERKGKDSVGIFLIRNNEEVLVRMQPLCAYRTAGEHRNDLHPCPVTGSIDPDDESYLTCAIREAYEETGYHIENAHLLTSYVTGTQIDEICYLYWADVTGLEPDIPPLDGSVMERIAKNEWKPLAFLKECEYSACQIGYWLLKEELSKKQEIGMQKQIEVKIPCGGGREKNNERMVERTT